MYLRPGALILLARIDALGLAAHRGNHNMFLSLLCYFCHIHRLLGSAVHSPTTYPSTPYHLGRAARGVKKTRDVDLYRHQFR